MAPRREALLTLLDSANDESSLGTAALRFLNSPLISVLLDYDFTTLSDIPKFLTDPASKPKIRAFSKYLLRASKVPFLRNTLVNQVVGMIEKSSVTDSQLATAATWLGYATPPESKEDLARMVDGHVLPLVVNLLEHVVSPAPEHTPLRHGVIITCRECGATAFYEPEHC